jgi:hypothetical protein
MKRRKRKLKTQNNQLQTNGELKNLGYLNNWHENPPKEVVKCRKLNHIRDWHRIDACVDEVECRKCGYKYKIDSGD